MNKRLRLALPMLLAASLLMAAYQPDNKPGNASFTLAIIPDTQNYIDFRHQTAEDFELNASALFIEQMQYIAEHSIANGGDIAFVASVGDVWQHQTKTTDAEHLRRGIGIEKDPILARRAKRTEQVLSVELPTAIEGYRIISKAGLPFGVAPGNHDYDASWSVAGYPPNRAKKWSEMTPTVEDLGILHVGGLDNFRTVFGENTDFFRDKPWYISSFRGGANSAQKFSAGGYDFLHIALEMQPSNSVLDWVESVLAANPGLPTILTTHDYLSPAGERLPNPLVDLVQVDPEFHNSAEQLWQNLLYRHDQIFMLLCGHQHGQSIRTDNNTKGNPVYQILANYQDRGQAAIEAGRTKDVGIGDGWLRLMHFDFSTTPATITVKTFSSYYRKFSSAVGDYANWYRDHEQPDMTDAEFYAADDFVISLDGFTERFSAAR